MSTLLRHLVAIAILPFTVLVLIPRWLLGRPGGGDARWVSGADWHAATLLLWLERGAGVLVLVLGFVLFTTCVMLFARVGEGTLAPWDPTRHLVAAGPYRHVRNPMISAVLLMLIGEAIMFRSRPVAMWAAIFFLINHFYFLLIEEPGLARRLGEPYARYRANVPRWLPRLKAWKP